MAPPVCRCGRPRRTQNVIILGEFQRAAISWFASGHCRSRLSRSFAPSCRKTRIGFFSVLRIKRRIRGRRECCESFRRGSHFAERIRRPTRPPRADAAELIPQIDATFRIFREVIFAADFGRFPPAGSGVLIAQRIVFEAPIVTRLLVRLAGGTLPD